jgi:hypothetical protein
MKPSANPLRRIRETALPCPHLRLEPRFATIPCGPLEALPEEEDALEAGNQISLLEPYFANVGKRLVKSPKLYFNDTGLLCFLLGMSREALSGSPLIGAIWENFVFTEISKWLGCYRPEWSVWFYRDQEQREADFLVEGPAHRLRVLDAKWSEEPRRDAFSRLESVQQLLSRVTTVKEIEIALVLRSPTSHVLAAPRHIVSAFEIGKYLE